MTGRILTMEEKESGASSVPPRKATRLVLSAPNNTPQDVKTQSPEDEPPRVCHSPKPLSPISRSSTSLPTSPSSSTLNTNTFEVQTLKAGVESGFSYHQRLFENHVPPAEWKRFSDELVDAFALTTTEKIAAWTVGISVGLVSAVPLLVFGAAPGYYAGKAVNNMSRETKVLEYLQDEGELVTVLRRWNETFFKSKGLYVRVALPRSKTKEGPKPSGGTFDSLMTFGSKRKGKGKSRSSSQDGDNDEETTNKEEKKLHKRYRLIIEVLRPEVKRKALANHGTDIPLPKEKLELEGDDGHPAAPVYTPTGPPPYKSGTHPAELEPSLTRQAVELDGPRNGIVPELEGGNAASELHGGIVASELPGTPKQPVYELA